jgi:hypothetical protein
MRLKILLFVFLLWGSAVHAQDYIYNDTIDYLVITEYRGTETNWTYLELTNMGDKPVQLNQFKVGYWGGNHTLDYVTGQRTGGATNARRIPVDKILEPGESYVFAHIKDYRPKKFKEAFLKGDVAVMKLWEEKMVQDNMWKAADFYVHITENEADSSGMDMKSTDFTKPFDEQWGGNGFFIQQHFANGDSMVIDQVGATFTGENGLNPDRTSPLSIFSIAGIPNAMRTQYLIRRFSIKKGNLDFNNARGVGLDDSEWIPIPFNGWNAWRLAPWTVGNHANYVLDQNTLESDVIEVDFANKKLTVPWGIRRGDDIMSYFKEKPGIGWKYVMGAAADSLSHGAQTGDQLNIYVCGDVLSFATFDIVVKDPTASENRVVPASNWSYDGGWRNIIENGFINWPRVTKKTTGMDSIWAQYGGIPYATRVDSLYDVLRKPANATWKIVYASGVEKPDLSNGDILRVTAQNGTARDYYIAVMPEVKSVNALLSSITWPDIPEFYKGLYGWIGDTIPNFGTSVFNYNVQVPLMAEGIPALVATKGNVNSTVEVTRAKNLTGTDQDRTISFTVTAEDDTTINKYNVVLSKELDPENLQPYHADPFISEYTRNMYWNSNWMLEIVNPGNQPLDLSNYMITMGNNDLPTLIANKQETNWLNRYEKYIPGYKWANEADWMVNKPYLAQFDIAVNPIVMPGDVFVAGLAQGENNEYCTPGWNNPMQTQVDVQLGNTAPPTTKCRTYVNQWGEKINNGVTFLSKNYNNSIYLLKILNDSIQRGLKPATDPNDFELIDVLGETTNTTWTIGTLSAGAVFSLQRKPHITKGNPLPSSALGESLETSEYKHITSNYLNSAAGGGWGWPWRMLKQWDDYGKHYFVPSTAYMSTIASVVYKVSEGYSLKEQIRGITTGTKVADFLANVIKKNENQSLKVISVANGAELALDALLSLNDTLTVLSADSTNTTKYVLEVLAEGLSSNAVITSTRFKVTVDVQPKSASDEHTAGSGTVSGFDYGTALRTVINNITVPAGANLSVISADGSYVPLKQLNFDSTYVFVTVNSEIYLDVLAENGITNIKYRLTPQSSPSAAFVLSNKYSVSQKDLLIDFVPGGINVPTFLSYLVPSEGASIKVVDKMGFERMDGAVTDDDKLVVTSADKTVTAVYHIGRLATQYVSGSTYLAYILSKEYAIDQVVYKVAGVSGAETVSNFLTKVTPAAGASVAVVDKNGDVKINGDIDGGDMVKVTSADGKIVVYYAFGPLTSADWMQAAQIELYPNPSNGKLNVTGVEKGQRIQVFNSVGAAIIDINVESTHEILSIEKHPAGLYMIVVSDKTRLLGKYKAVKY